MRDMSICPICDEELKADLYCAGCNKKWTQEEMDQHEVKASNAYMKRFKKNHPEFFGEVE